MNKHQIQKRVSPEVIVRVLREWNDDGITTKMAMEAWPEECVSHLERMLESSGEHGPDYALHADELDRLYGFRRDRSNVRKYCETHMGKLLRKLFPLERKQETNERIWTESPPCPPSA